VRGTLGLASLDGGQREAGEVGTAGLLGPTPALVGLQEALWVHFTVEAGQERGPTVRRGLPRIVLSVQRVRGEAGAEASLSSASRLISRAGNRQSALGGLMAHLKLVLSPWPRDRCGWLRDPRRCSPHLRGRLEHTERTI
jgi:hypothetical protein